MTKIRLFQIFTTIVELAVVVICKFSLHSAVCLIEVDSQCSGVSVSLGFISEFLKQNGNETLIEEFDMQPFEISVLDKRRTLTEKLVSLIRCSLADNYSAEYIQSGNA